jgi:uncharacterized protein (TIGR03437 family)
MHTMRFAGALFVFNAVLAFGQSAPSITSVVDPYTGSANLSPGGLALIQGTLLGSAPGVKVGGEAAYTVIQPALYGGSRLTIQIPVDLPPGLTSVSVSPSTGTATFPITIAQYAPVLVNAASGTLLSPAHSSGVPVTASAPATPGESLTLSAIGLGPTSPSVLTGQAAPSGAVTTATPTLTFAGSTLSGVTAALQPGTVGIYQIVFTVPAATLTGNYAVSLSIGGATSNSFQIPVATASSSPQIAAVLDPVRGTASLSPGQLAVLYGLNPGPNPVVTIGGKTAALISNPQNGQLIIQIPVDASTTGSVNATLGNSAPYSLTLAPYAPVLYSSMSGINISPMHVDSGAPVTAANPALGNEQIAVFATGLGATNPLVPTGTPAPLNVSAVQPIGVLLNNVNVPPPTVTLVAGQVGVFEIIFTVPASPATGNFVTLSIQVGSNLVRSFPIYVPTALTSAPPAVSGLSNIYSYIAPGVPNYGIAQGSIFAIFGTHLAQGNTGKLLQPPLGTAAAKASASVTVNGTTTQVLLYYASPGQLVGILPSSTPVGDGSITISNGLSSSAPFAIHVVQSAFGILTLNAGGSGPAAAFDLQYNYLGFTNALNPGDIFVLWGTGVGPVSGNEGDTQVPVDLGPNVPMTLEVGGIQAQLIYHGRSTFPGLDQVIGVVPPDVLPGCWVSVVARTGDVMSNFATLPVAATGRTCSDPVLGLTTSAVQAIASKSSFNLGYIQLAKDGAEQPTGGGAALIVNDLADAQFLNVKTSDFASFTLGPSIGSCLISRTYDGPSWGSLPSTTLDAGPAINVTGPLGSMPVSWQGDASAYLTANGPYLIPPDTLPWPGGGGLYGGFIGGLTVNGTLPFIIPPNGGGVFTLDNGPGGSAVGAFSAQIPFLSSFFSWPQLSNYVFTSINLSQTTFQWSNADPKTSYIQITGRVPTSGSSGPIVDFVCAAPANAGTFRIPDSVLLSLPSSISTLAGSQPFYGPRLQFSQVGYGQSFSAPGLDVAIVQARASVTTTVLYQK